MAFLQMVRMVMFALTLLAALGWLPWILLRPLRERISGWVATPFLGLAVLEVFSWYWLEYGSGGMRSGLAVLGTIWAIGTVLVVTYRRARRAPLFPPIAAGGIVSTVLVIGAAIALSALIMSRGLQGDRPVPTTFGNADTAQYALSAEVLLDEGFEGKGWIRTGELGALGRSDNGGVRPFLASVAIVNNTSVWNATTPALTIFVVLTALAASWTVRAATRARSMTAALLGLGALLPFSFTFIVGQQYLAQVAAMAGTLALLAVLLEQRPRTWRDTLEVGLPAGFMLTPIVLSYPQMALAALAVLAAVMTLVAADQIHRAPLIETAKSMIRSVSILLIASASSIVVLAPAISGLLDRVSQVGGVAAGWPMPQLSPIQVVGLESFGPMTGISRSRLIGQADPSPLSSSEWWAGALLVIGLTLVASAVSWRRNGQAPLFPLATSTVVLISFRVFYDREGDSYAQWKWVTFFQPLLAIAILVALWTLVHVLQDRYPSQRRVLLGSTAVLSVVGAVILLGPVIRLSTGPWWFVTDDLSDVRRVSGSGLSRVTVDVDPYAETMWVGYFLKPISTDLQSASYFPASVNPTGWVLTKSEYVTGAPLREVTLNSTYRLVCYVEPCSPAPKLGPP